ncbi:MAG: (d)CMP kinase [Candidatus Rokubacteria bacterium]|nr:(d)CMP kinase [Candidatus Rokubacteria bacterium]
MSGGACRRPVITIDGPAGAGKSTVARALARRLGFRLIDTGAIYRGAAWAVRAAGLAPEDGPALRALLERTVVELIGERVLVDGTDVTHEIRSPEIGELTSVLSMLRPVREAMTPLQQGLAAPGGVVLEGRDTGTVVCPSADVKFYLDADPEARARRRQQELRARGRAVSLDEVRAEVARRDRQDMTREVAPLRRPEDAVLVDSTSARVEDIVERLLETVQEIMERRCSTPS